MKNFHDLEAFQNIDREIAGKGKRIDLLKVDDKYCINITNYGFDGEVTFAQLKYKRRPFMSPSKQAQTRKPALRSLNAFKTI